MSKRGQHTLNEILSQTAAWGQALEVVESHRDAITQLWKAHPEIRALFTGCGSTYYLSWAAASLFQQLTGRGARPFPGGELILYPQTAYETDTPALMIAISRSGTTSETVAAVQKFQAAGRGPVVAITNYADTPLTAAADVSLVISAGQEQSVAQTRSFASMYVAVTAFAALAAGRKDLLSQMQALPVLGEQLIEKYEALARSLGENLVLDRFYFLGSGPRYGLACEVNLKMKEMTLTHSEPFHFFEFRHGPMSMVGESAAVIGLRSSVNARHEQTVLDEMQAMGGQVLSLGEAEADVCFESGLPEEIRNVLYLPVLQLMAYYRSMAKGLDPDQPKNLNAVVTLNLENL
ncbi:MAG TPA: SIS domain-containing protein [Chloroflexi bacterium]|nr:SIS domain-containing protein [Chloroflexota bacterium]